MTPGHLLQPPCLSLPKTTLQLPRSFSQIPLGLLPPTALRSPTTFLTAMRPSLDIADEQLRVLGPLTLVFPSKL